MIGITMVVVATIHRTMNITGWNAQVNGSAIKRNVPAVWRPNAGLGTMRLNCAVCNNNAQPGSGSNSNPASSNIRDGRATTKDSGLLPSQPPVPTTTG
jgi:hypothetical protein